MKYSRVLRSICYVLMPILITIVILSTTYIVLTDDGSYNSEKAFFLSDNFKYAYMNRIRDYMNELIYAQNDHKTIQDGEKTIYFTGGSSLYGIENFTNYIVIYQNKAITNVKFTNDTNTVEKIKAYVLESKKNRLCYENAKYSSNIEGFTDDIERYFNDSQFIYYTVDHEISISVQQGNDIQTPEQNMQTPEQNMQTPEPNVQISQQTTNTVEQPYLVEEVAEEVEEGYDGTSDVEATKREYHTANVEDFTYYTSFNDTFEGNVEINLIINTLKILEPYKNIIISILPISAILTLIIAIYLVNSIGYVKGKDGIHLTDFDKIPLEVILLIWFIIVAISIGIMEELSWDRRYTSIDAIIAIVSTLYITNFAGLEAVLITSIVRVKAKKFLDTCICGRILKWSWKVFKKILKKCIGLLIKVRENLKKARKNLRENVSLTWMLIIIIGVYIIGSMILLGIFGPLGAIVDLAVFIYAIYQIILRINSFQKLEDSLKKIYEGEKVTLYTSDFTNEFEKSVEYINDISNGFENAIEQGLKSERLKTELITNVSHDIKTPLTSIINYVDLIKKENIDNEKLKEYVDILDNKSQRLKKLTEDLVEASKASSGNVSLNLETIGITELLNQAIGEYKDKFEEKKLEVISSLSKDDIKIKADSRYLYRVIENLFGNISKYALDGSRVYIETKKKDGRVSIILKNISKDRLNISEEELMQRFVRGDKSRTTEGSGLGLAIARSLTELQKGTLNCKIDGDLFKVEIEFNII